MQYFFSFSICFTWSSFQICYSNYVPSENYSQLNKTTKEMGKERFVGDERPDSASCFCLL